MSPPRTVSHLLFLLTSLIFHPSTPPLSLFPNPTIYSTLQSTKSILFIDMPVALLLHTVLEHHGNAQDKNDIDADDTKSSREDLIEVPVCKRREFADAAALLRGNERVLAGAVLDKGWGG